MSDNTRVIPASMMVLRWSMTLAALTAFGVGSVQAQLPPRDPFVVNSTADDPDTSPGDGVCATATPDVCTLRAAIQEANALDNVNSDTPDEHPDRIQFGIPGIGPHTIQPGSPGLPIISESVVIDGYTQPGSSVNTLALGSDAVLMIELDGTIAGVNAHGLIVNRSGITIRGMVINRFAQDGIFINGWNSGLIEGCFIGTDTTGTVALGNGNNGIGIVDSASNTIGGSSPSVRNLVSGNDQAGVFIGNGPAQGNTIQGNMLGTDASGTTALGNGLDGVLISAAQGQTTYASFNTIGGPDPGQGNLISGNGRSGVTVFRGAHNHILGNLIGTDAPGSTAVPNAADGVVLDEASDNVVGGGASGAGNVMSGNGSRGVAILAETLPASSNRVWGNLIGTDRDGVQAVPNQGGGLALNSRAGATAGVVNNVIGATDAEDGAEDGQQWGRNVISGNDGNGVDLLGALVNNNVILGNFIGVDATGIGKLGNALNGVLISEAAGQDGAPTSNHIGMDVHTGGNIVSANGRDGIQISFGASGNFVLNNTIGLDVVGIQINEAGDVVSGDTCGNARHGVALFDSPNNLIGLGTVAARNVISGNGEHGVFIGVGGGGGGASGNAIRGNFIGTNHTGFCADSGCFAGNGADGVRIEDAPGTVIGGDLEGDRNVISGNVGSGVHIFGNGSENTLLLNNLIGVALDGFLLAPNTQNGITVEGAPMTRIGDGLTGVGNVIAGNLMHGIHVSGSGASGTRIEHNRIGVGNLGANLGNGRDGVRIEDTSDTYVGGTEPGAANEIRYNGDSDVQTGNGVTIVGGSRNRVLRNEIAANDGLAIDLDDDGLTPNDTLDLDDGANARQNFPVYNARVEAGQTTIEGFLQTAPLGTYRLEFYTVDEPDQVFTQGGAFLGHLDVDSGVSGLVFFTAQFAGEHPLIGATATDADGNTSEYSQTLIHSIEVTQAIQEWQLLAELKNDLRDDGQPPVPIVAQKRTALRIYPRPVEQSVYLEFLVTVPGAAPFFQGATLSPGCQPDMRRRATHNCTSIDIPFTAPHGEWDVVLEVSREGLLVERHEFTFHSIETRGIVLDAVRVCETVSPDSSCAFDAEEDLKKIQGLVELLTPAPSITVVGNSNVIRRHLLSGDINSDGDLDDCLASGCEPEAWWSKVLADIHSMTRPLATDDYWIRYGVTRPLATSTQGIAYIALPSGVSMSGATRLKQDAAAEILAHEVGHTLGRQHTHTSLPVPQLCPSASDPTTPCACRPGCDNLASSTMPSWPYADNTLQSGPADDPVPQVGYDVRTMTPKLPESHFDVLSYCFPAWIAPHNYVAMVDFLAVDAGRAPAMAGAPGPHWLITGSIMEGGIDLEPLFVLDTTPPPSPLAGDYRLESRDDQDAVIDSLWFTATSAQDSTTGPPVEGPPSFAALLPVQSGVTRIVIVDVNDVELMSIPLTGVAPTVSCTFPVGGETLSGLQTLTWDVQNADSSTHTFRVEYAPNDMSPWRQLASDWTATSLTVDFDAMPGAAGTGRIRVLASDGVNTGSGESGAFSVPMKLPTGRITSPADGQLFRLTEQVWFQGYAFDRDDGFLTADSLAWSSDLQGDVGTGESVYSQSLVEGQHVITMTGTDSAGNTISDNITIIVANVPIVETFTSPGQLQFAPGAYMVDETVGVAPIVVERVNGSAGMVSVDYIVSDDTATAGSDYIAASGTLTFADGQIEASFDIQIINDNALESTESINLALGATGGGATLGAPTTAALLIEDDDTATADTFVVINTDDAGAGSLRQAILDANASSGLDIITFDIPGTGVHTIAPLSQLPTITDPVLINGYTQPGSTPNTWAAGSSAALRVELTGASAPIQRGLVVAADDCHIQGLAIHSFINVGIDALNAHRLTLTGNFIGCDPSGTVALGNLRGLFLNGGDDCVIGGTSPAARNLISGNASTALRVLDSDRNVIQGNIIGLAADGVSPLGNGGDGIQISGSNNLVGGLQQGAANVIAFNGLPSGSGVVVTSGTGNALRANRIFSNTRGQIRVPAGPGLFGLPDAGDDDDGPNLQQNYPIVRAATSTSAGLTLQVELDSTPDTQFEVDVYGSVAPDIRGFGGGETYLGTGVLTTPTAGSAAQEFTLDVQVPDGHIITATVTDPAGNTSGFSERVAVGDVLGDPVIVNTTDHTDDGICDMSHCSMREAIHEANLLPGPGTLLFDIPGSGVHSLTVPPFEELPTVTEALVIDGFSQPGSAPNTLSAGNNAVMRVQLVGQKIGSILTGRGVTMAAGPSMVRGLVINRCSAGLFLITDDFVVEGNFIGVDPTGSIGGDPSTPGSFGNVTGIAVVGGGTGGAFIGGTTPAARNVISASVSDGIDLNGTVNSIIQGNYIGTDAQGLAPLDNGIGTVQGGIRISDSGSGGPVLIGGTTMGAGNLISSNEGYAIALNGDGHIIQGNLIGTDRTGTEILDPFGQFDAIQINGVGNTVGGSAMGAGNLIGGNDRSGIRTSTDSSGTIIQGNAIGTDFTGQLNLGNGEMGLRIAGSGHLIGGTGPGEANIIAFNGDNGLISPCDVNPALPCGGVGITGSGVAVLSNIMFANNGPGIDLANDDVTPNDPDDADEPQDPLASNRLQNSPSLASATLDASGHLVIHYLVDSAPGFSTYPMMIEFFIPDGATGAGRTLLGHDSYPEADAQQNHVAVLNGADALGLQVGDTLVSTATDADGNTSEFSAVLEVVEGAATDCAGVMGGTAFLDDCGVCSGGATGHEANSDQDCSGACFGDAGEDDCGVCAGGATGLEPNADADCTGLCFGDAVVDGCGICSGGTTEHVADSDKDCNGDCFGDAFLDSCNVCSGGASGHEADSDRDCAGVCFGDAALDICAVCAGGMTGVEPGADQDCADVCFGNAQLDDCGVCAGGSTGLEPNSDQDCTGTCFGSAAVDACGVCAGGDTGLAPDADQDCNGDCFGDAFIDVCGLCAGGNSGMDPSSPEDCAEDCAGVTGGSATVDACGVCSGGTTGVEPNADQDCNGDCFGSAFPDDCGICSEGNTGHPANDDQDCAFVCFGAALVDQCGVCAGGTTGVEPNADQDCSGVCLGEATVDDCGVCAGGTTGLVPNADQDCNGDCFGDAFIDDCGLCAGGDTGLPPSEPGSCGTAFLDIKPGSCPNAFNAGAGGFVTMALVGTPEFDPETVDLGTIVLQRADGIGGQLMPHAGPRGPRLILDDVATPFTGVACDCHGLQGDGIDDVLLKFRRSDLVDILELLAMPEDEDIVLVVTGLALDGAPFSAEDCIRLTPSSE